MRTIGTFLLSAVAIAAATSASACPNCKRGYVFGKPVAIGNGMAFVWAKMGAGPNKVESMGVTFTETALEGLPDLKDKSMPMAEYILELPKEVKGKPFDHIGLNWVPQGHEPANIYTKPHFDIHFYSVTQEERAKMTAKGADLQKMLKKPDAKFIPEGYIAPPGGALPFMGNHWIDPKSKEFGGQEFDVTFIYGTYNGKMAFWEPMITTKFLSSKPSVTAPIPQPKAFDATGFYPSAYSIKHNEARKEITVSLEGLKYVEVARPANTGVAKKKK